jgi:hypothetical protein
MSLMIFVPYLSYFLWNQIIMNKLQIMTCALCLMLSACQGGSSDDAALIESVVESPNDSSNENSDNDSGNDSGNEESIGAQPTQADIDRHCDDAAFPSAEWAVCEKDNFAKNFEGPTEGLNLAFQAAVLAQSAIAAQSYAQRLVDDPSYLPVALPLLDTILQGLSAPDSLGDRLMAIADNTLSNPAGTVLLPLNTPLLTECSMQAGPCVGDPFRYPGVDGPDGRDFYEKEAKVDQITFYDRECARLAGHVWRPRGTEGQLPTVVFEVGSVGAPETLYWWLPQLLVRHGYAVMTFEVRGQGRSDFSTPVGGQGTNVNPKVFWENFVDAVDFVRSSPNTPYPNEISCAGTYPTVTDAFNPQHEAVDLERLGVVGHSLSGIGVTALQGYGGMGSDPWPGQIDSSNPVDVAVAFDGLIDPNGVRPGGAIGSLEVILPELMGELARLILLREFPNVGPRVPIMGQSSDYGLFTAPYLTPPDPEFHKGAYEKWRAAKVPVYEFTVQGSSHLDWSQAPPLPGSSFCPDPESGECENGFGLPMAEYYTLAWLDRWMKKPGEQGYATADARLLDDAGPQSAAKMSFRFNSARDFPDRSGFRHQCQDIRAGCIQ